MSRASASSADMTCLSSLTLNPHMICSSTPDPSPNPLHAALACRDDETDKVVFRGWARMAVPIEDYTIIEVRKPNVGENKPADVTADIVIDTSSKHGFLNYCSVKQLCCTEAPAAYTVHDTKH